MIDTVILILSQEMYKITAYDKFTPSANWVHHSFNSTRGIQSKQNPTKKELRNDIYKPRLTISNHINLLGRPDINLKIELSLPKLFFGNNFDELKLKDFNALVNKIVDILKEMGVLTSADIISKAPIFMIHFSKNIPLTDGSIPYHFINKLKESNIKLSLDVNQTDYRNDGHSYKWHCNSYEVIFYDKIKDLEKTKQSSKRAIEKDSDLQLNIFNKLKNNQKIKKLEILRMEVRLNKRSKIKQLFKKLDIKSNLTFKSIFKPSISKKVLLHYFDELESKRSNLIDYKSKDDKELLAVLIFNNQELSPKQIIQIFGLKKIFELVNPRELRVMFNHCSKRSWYRLVNDLNKVKLPATNISFGIIKESLMKFRAISLIKFLK